MTSNNPVDFYPPKVFKFCPKCGSNEFTANSEQMFHCNHCGLDYYINPAATSVCLILNEKNELLMVKRARDPEKGTWDLPGGFSNLFETIEDCAVREVKEELGLDVVDLKFFCSSPNQYLYGGLTYFTMDMAFFCRVKNLDGIKADDDAEEYKFMNPLEIDINTIGLQSIKNIVKKYQDSL